LISASRLSELDKVQTSFSHFRLVDLAGPQGLVFQVKEGHLLSSTAVRAMFKQAWPHVLYVPSVRDVLTSEAEVSLQE
jgi:hypothetical protein